MRKITILILGLVLVFNLSCKKDTKDNTEITDDNTIESVESTVEESATYANKDGKITVKLEPKSGSDVSGNIVFKQSGDIVQMVAVMSGLSEGNHAIHIHEKADCSSDDGKSTGGHWNPMGQPHGKFGNAKGYHKGDIGNFQANDKGQGTMTFVTKEWCIGCGDPQKDILGKAVIVHQGVDDFVTQPTGAAGGRVSCGGIIE